MRKEVILAVIIGVLLGIVILYGINLANTSSKINQDGNIRNNNTQTAPPPAKKPDNQVSIVFPQDNAVVTEAQLTLKGSSEPNSSVAIITENDDIITITDNTGSFSSVINLISGENFITVTAVDKKQATTSASLTVIRTITLPK